MKEISFEKFLKNRIFRIALFLLIILLPLIGSNRTSYAEETIRYVSASGSDTTGTGTLAKPYKSIYKAYDAISSTGTIALLSDITIDSTDTQTIITGGKNITITSADSSGNILTNAANNYDGVHKIIRGSAVQSLLVVQDGNLTLKQIILDGGSKNFNFEIDYYIPGNTTTKTNNQGGYLVNVFSSAKNATFTLDTNSVLQNNWNIGNSGSSWAGAVCMSYDNNAGSPVMYMKSNAIIRGNKAPRHGGAMTSYTGKVYIQDDAKIYNNCIYYNSTYTQQYFGGGALLVYRTSELYMSGNASIENNYVDLNGNSGKAVAVQVEISGKIYLSGNARIFDNFTKNVSGVADNTQANVYDKTDSGNSLIIEGTLGDNALIGITAKTLSNGAKVAEGNGLYTVTADDADKIFDDSLTYRVIKHSTNNTLVLSSEITQLSVASSTINSTVLTLSLNEGISLKINDTSIFKNGTQIEKSKYSVTSDKANKKVTITFTDKLTIEDTIGVQISKNGYKFNSGAIYTITPTHTHSMTYSASGASLKATCSDLNGLCPITSEDKSVTITFTPTSPAYTTGGNIGWKEGQTIGFTFAGQDAWKSANGESSIPTIYYEGTGSTTYTKSTTKPTTQGNYKATITVDEATAFINFYILKVCTVSFNVNGGRGSMSSIEVASGQYTLPDCIIKAPRNKEFDGWSLVQNGPKESATINLQSNITLYALWKNHEHELKTSDLGNGMTQVSCDCGFYIIKYN